MSQSDGFIEEVTDELRRERLFRLLRRYGWIAALAIIVIVGGAALNEWRKARAEAEAQAFGDALLAALDADTPEARRAALDALQPDGVRRALVAMLTADTLEDDAARDATYAALGDLAEDGDLPRLYRQLAALKHAMLGADSRPPAETRADLDPLTAPGAPFRLLALEQVALTHAAEGDADAAIAILRDVIADGAAGGDLRNRARQLIVALGGSLEAA